MVERAIPRCGSWPRRTVLAARLEGSVAALARLLDGQDVDEAAACCAVAAGAPTAGRALGAANAALPWPDEPLAVLWQAATVLRELRGDGHVLAQLAVGLDGLSTMVLRSGHDLDREALQPNRGWTDEEWAASAALTDRGLLGPDGRITRAGSTSSTAPRPSPTSWPRSPGRSPAPRSPTRFTELAAPLAAAARTALPPVNPIGLPRADPGRRSLARARSL